MAEINLSKEESFDLINEKLTGNYEAILKNMTSVSNMIKLDPENQCLKELLYSLAESAIGIISTQISFAYTYVDKKYGEIMVNNLLEKRRNLLEEVSLDLANTDKSVRNR